MAADQPNVVGAGLFMLLQGSVRLTTLALAQIQVRMVAAEAFGVAHIHLELLLGTILTLSRDGVRNALSRYSLSVDEKNSKDRSSISNVALLPIAVGAFIAIAATTFYTNYLAPASLTAHPHFHMASSLFMCGALLEILAEPLYIDAMRHLHVGRRISAEGFGVLSKGVVTLSTMLWIQHANNHEEASSSILPFGVGQLAYGIGFLSVFLISSLYLQGTNKTVRMYIPRCPPNQPWFDPTLLKLTISMTRQNFVKHILGEGDKFAISRFASLSEQGAYALSSNYASLLARILYQPIEESTRLSFSTLMGSDRQVTPAVVSTVHNLLRTFLSLYSLLTAYLLVFCPPFVTPLLLLISGRRWALDTTAPSILAAYGSIYLPIMAFNGLLEGFLQSCATSEQLSRYDRTLVSASAAFMALLAVTRHYLSHSISPEIGLVLASSLSTAIRTVYCFRFTQNYLATHDSTSPTTSLTASSVLPHPVTISVMVVAGSFLHVNNLQNDASLWQSMGSSQAKITLLYGAMFLMLSTTSVLFNDINTLKASVRAIKGRRPSS